jgi:hypothetical protein
VIPRLCHNLNLQRCYGAAKLSERLLELNNLPPPSRVAAMSMSGAFLLQTGNRILAIEGSPVAYDLPRFVECSTSVAACFKRLLSVRTFAQTNFISVYDATQEIFQHQVFGSVLTMLNQHAEQAALHASAAKVCFKAIESKAFLNSGELVQDNGLGVACGRIWTCTDAVGNRPFHGILNDILRADDKAAVSLAMPFVTSINKMCVTRRTGSAVKVDWPDDNKLCRGTSFDDKHQSFYTPGMRFRIPQFLATTKQRDIADRFSSKVMWIVHLPGQCCQVNYFERITQFKGEHEFLFAPYSVFTVRSVSWQQFPSHSNPHLIELDATADNRDESLHLPLSPWN